MKVTDRLFCDDIRYEQNNKVSLMGVYGDQLVFRIPSAASASHKWPIPFQLALYIRLRVDEADTALPDSFQLQFLMDGKREIAAGKGSVVTDNTQKLISLAVVVESLPVRPGVLGYELKLYKNGAVTFEDTKANALEVRSEVVAAPAIKPLV